MKPFIRYLTILMFTVLAFLLLFQLNLHNGYKFLYGKQEIGIEDLKDNISYAEYEAFLDKFSHKHQVNISGFTYFENNELYSYHTNLKKDRAVHLSKKQNRLLKQGKHLSNDVSTTQGSTVGLQTPGLKVQFYPYSEMKNVGWQKTLYLDTNDAKLITKFTDQLKKYAQFTQEKSESIPFIDFTSPLFIGSVSLALLLLFFEIIYIYQRRMEYQLYLLWGFSKQQAITRPMNYMMVTLLYAWIPSLVSVVLLNSIQKNALFTNIVPVLIGLFLLTTGLVAIMYAMGAIYLFFREKTLAKLLFAGSLIGKYFAVFCLFLFFLQSIQQYMELENGLARLDHWKKTKNMYSIAIRFQPELEKDLTKDEKNANKLVEFYHDLAEKKGGFVFNSDNFRVIRDRAGHLAYSYTEHPKRNASNASLYGHKGIAVVASANYFTYNPVQATTGKDVRSYFSRDANTLNLVVPHLLKKHEQQIKALYQETFYFQKVEVENMYREAAKKKKSSLKKSDLKINIVYAKDNSTYYTYNSETGSPKTNQITDPVVTIYDNKIHSSFLSSYLSGKVFFKDSHQGKTYKTLLPTIKKLGLTQSVMATPSVYNELGERIQIQKTKLHEIVINLVMIGFISILLLGTSIYFICQLKQRRLYIKSIIGYSFWELAKAEWLYVCFPTIVMMVLFYLLAPIQSYALLLAGYTLFEIVIVYLFLRSFLNQNIKAAIQRERN